MNIPFLQVDAFTSEPFTGNPAGVCLLDEVRPDDWMQRVAAEINLSETAFLMKIADGYNLRWFTPKVEVPLCGHGTLASAHAIWEAGLAKPGDTLAFNTLSGWLHARRVGQWIELDFPCQPVVETKLPGEILEALGLPGMRFGGRSGENYFVEVESEEAVVWVQPDFDLLATLPGHGLIVTAKSRLEGVDFVSRYFAPWVGIDEDPVTGSAHCALAPYWSQLLGKGTLSARQISRRGGLLEVEVAGERVKIRGQAVTVLRGELLV